MVNKSSSVVELYIASHKHVGLMQFEGLANRFTKTERTFSDDRQARKVNLCEFGRKLSTTRRGERHSVARPFVCLSIHSVLPAKTPHTDLRRPDRWPKLIPGKTTEAMQVVSILLNYASTAHPAMKKNVT